MNELRILLERDGAVGWIRINRPERLNAFAGSMRDELLDALRQLEAERDVEDRNVLAHVALHALGERLAAARLHRLQAITGALALAYRRVGRAQAADNLLRGLGDASGGRARLNLGLAYAMQGDLNHAIPLLELAEWAMAGLINLRSDPLLRPLRADPRFGGLARRLGITAGP